MQRNTTLAWLLTLFAGAALAADTGTGRMLNQSLGCSGCHGETGISSQPYTPNLAGQDKHYLAKQLRHLARGHEFMNRHGRLEKPERTNSTMSELARRLSSSEIEVLAEFFSSQKCLVTSATAVPNPPDFGRGCVRCHGPGGVNIIPATPDLAGQKRQYLLRQLRAFRAAFSGSSARYPKRERFDPVMAGHGVRLTDDQLETLASYFSAIGCSPPDPGLLNEHP